VEWLTEFHAVLGMTIRSVHDARVDAMRQLRSLKDDPRLDELPSPAVPRIPGSETAASRPMEQWLPRPRADRRPGQVGETSRPRDYLGLVPDPVTRSVRRQGFPEPVYLSVRRGELLWNLFQALYEARESDCPVTKLKADWNELVGRPSRAKKPPIHDTVHRLRGRLHPLGVTVVHRAGRYFLEVIPPA
jgi:hypothetical protein